MGARNIRRVVMIQGFFWINQAGAGAKGKTATRSALDAITYVNPIIFTNKKTHDKPVGASFMGARNIRRVVMIQGFF